MVLPCEVNEGKDRTSQFLPLLLLVLSLTHSTKSGHQWAASQVGWEECAWQRVAWFSWKRVLGLFFEHSIKCVKYFPLLWIEALSIEYDSKRKSGTGSISTGKNSYLCLVSWYVTMNFPCHFVCITFGGLVHSHSCYIFDWGSLKYCTLPELLSARSSTVSCCCQ